MSDVITLTHDNFETEVLSSNVPVLVDYWSPWWSRALGPIIEEIAAERVGTLKVGKVNVDQEPHLAYVAGVHGIPHIVLYRDGKPVADAVGARAKAALESALGLDTDGRAAA
jgi:thioredoxin 1